MTAGRVRGNAKLKGANVERKDLNPMNVDGSHRGKRIKCLTCDRVNLYETGYLFTGVVEENEEAHVRYYWFCTLKCLLMKVQGGNA